MADGDTFHERRHDDRLALEKAALRRRCRGLRAALPVDERERLSRAVCEHLLTSDLVGRARTVAAYMAFDNEVSLSTLIEDLTAAAPQKQIVLPRIATSEARLLTFHVLSPGDLERHRYGHLEPAVGAPSIDPGAIDLILVPGVAFDRAGHRIGYGMGYYDGLLGRLPAAAPRIGVSYDVTVVESVPAGDHDQIVSHLVTESGMSPISD